MRRRLAVTLAATTLAGTVVAVPAVAAPTGHSAATGRVCFSALTHQANYALSQNFEAEYDSIDSIAADDLQLTRKCRVRAVTVDGSTNDSDFPIRSETVTFYRDRHGRPGRAISTQTVVGAPYGYRGFDLTLDHPVRLRADVYWLSVQANGDFGDGTIWDWNTRTVDEGSDAVWMNPGDGLGTGCVDWDTLDTCLDVPDDGLVFEVRTR